MSLHSDTRVYETIDILVGSIPIGSRDPKSTYSYEEDNDCIESPASPASPLEGSPLVSSTLPHSAQDSSVANHGRWTSLCARLAAHTTPFPGVGGLVGVVLVDAVKALGNVKIRKYEDGGAKQGHHGIW